MPMDLSRPRSFSVLAGLLAILVPEGARGDAAADIVISEILYNPASGDRREDFVEIHNKGTVAHNLQGFRFEDGLVFTFPSIVLGAGQYLVVCGDQNRVRQVYGITNTVGNWDAASTLDNGGERLRLLDATGVEVEDLTYDDRNPWPILADGYGHSLEKRNLSGDNDDPANWSASSVGAGWTRVTVTGLATSSTLYLYLSQAGTAYVDDFRLFPVANPGNNRVQNAGFETAALTPWTASGNHSGSATSTEKPRTGSRSLKLTATAAGTGSGTSVTQGSMGLIDDDQYTLEFWVSIPTPGLRVIARLSGTGGQAEPIYVESGGGGATPGRVNSVNTTDIPPFIYPVAIVPETPTASAQVAVQAVAYDDVSLSSVTLNWDSGSGAQTRAMLDDGLSGDGAAADGVYGARIGSFPTGAIVRYHVTARDGAGQEGRYPFAGNPTTSLGFYIQPAGINPTFAARSNSGLTSEKPPVYHFVLSQSALDSLASNPTTYVRGSFIYNGEVFEDVRFRHRGQSSLGTPKRHWKVDFNKDHRFLTPFDEHGEIDNANVQSSYGDKSFLREWLSYKAWMDVGKPALEMWHVRVYLNQAYRGFYVHLENPDGDWMDRAGLDPEGWMWKSYSQARGGTSGFEPEEMADNATEANAALNEFMNAVNTLTGQDLVDYIEAVMDVDNFIDFLAIHQLIHNCDHPAKNYLVYADEDSPDGTWTYLGWDMDLTHGRNFECSGGGVYNDTMRADMFGDPQLLFGTSARPKCDGPWNGVINAFLFRTTAFRERYYVRTAQLLEQIYQPALMNAQIEDMAVPLLPEIEMDWNRNPPGYGSRSTARFHVDQLKGYIQNRYNYLSNALDNLTAPDLSELACARAGVNVNLSWRNNDSRYSAIRIYRSGTMVRTLAGSATSTSVPLDVEQQVNTFRVAPVFNSVERPGQSCTIVSFTAGYTVVVNQGFSPPASSADLSVNCNAQQTGGSLQLTSATGNQAGAAFFRTAYPVRDFIADFDVSFADPSSPLGADGMVFAMTRGDPTICGGPGGALGFWENDAGGAALPGYGVVFDTWQNPGEPSHNWVGFIDTARQASGAFSAVDVPEEFTGNGPFHVRVTGKDGVFTVFMRSSALGMAERLILTYTVPGFVEEDLRFGFTAGTGSAFTRHLVDNFILQVDSDEIPPVVAGFHADSASGPAPLTVSFVNDSTGASSYSWTFGDGGTSTEASPSHTYQSPGTYTVSLTSTGAGGTDVESKAGFITAAVVLEAAFTADKTVGPKPLSVRFTDQTRRNVDLVSRTWTFGDGTGSLLANPTHAYTRAGAFTVTLRVTGQGGATSTATLENYILVDDVLDAQFGADVTRGPAPLRVAFRDDSTGETIQSWRWDFGDGETAAVQDPVHTYTQPGVYAVELAINGFQAVDSLRKPAFIQVDPPVATATFLRGDGNGDLLLDISDGIAILNHLFTGGAPSRCRDAMDGNDDGGVDISDGISVLNYLFTGGVQPPPPFPAPGVDPTADSLPECPPPV